MAWVTRLASLSLTMMWSIRYHFLDLGWSQEPLVALGCAVLLMNKLCCSQNSTSLSPASLVSGGPWTPRAGEASGPPLPTLALKSPMRTSRSEASTPSIISLRSSQNPSFSIWVLWCVGAYTDTTVMNLPCFLNLAFMRRSDLYTTSLPALTHAFTQSRDRARPTPLAPFWSCSFPQNRNFQSSKEISPLPFHLTSEMAAKPTWYFSRLSIKLGSFPRPPPWM